MKKKGVGIWLFSLVLAATSLGCLAENYYFNSGNREIEILTVGGFVDPTSIALVFQCEPVNCNINQVSRQATLDLADSILRSKVYIYKYVVTCDGQPSDCDDLEAYPFLQGGAPDYYGKTQQIYAFREPDRSLEEVLGKSHLIRVLDYIKDYGRIIKEGIISGTAFASLAAAADYIISEKNVFVIVTDKNGNPIYVCQPTDAGTCKTIAGSTSFNYYDDGRITSVFNPADNSSFDPNDTLAAYDNFWESYTNVLGGSWRCITTSVRDSLGNVDWSSTCSYWP